MALEQVGGSGQSDGASADDDYGVSLVHDLLLLGSDAGVTQRRVAARR